MGVKQLPLIIFSLLAFGCAANHPTSLSQPPASPAATAPTYRPALASALCFDSAVTPGFPLPGLDRDAREPSAFLGYEESVTENYFVFTDDDQSGFPSQNSYDREAVSVISGTRSR
jgi:hypothetical protein